MREPLSSLRMGVFAWESDLLDAEQLARAVVKWSAKPESSLMAHLIADGSLTEADSHLLNALWAERTTDARLDMTRGGWHTSDLSQSLSEFAESDADLPRLTANHHFDLVSTLATGGLGRISVALDKTLNRRVAIKEMLPRHAECAEARLRFFREAELTSQLEHPAVVPIHNLGFTAQGTPFYSMRLIEGKTIRDLARDLNSSESNSSRFNSLGFRRLLGSFITVCQAVAHAHSRHIIHRDIKPANIVVGENGETMLVDWGLAKNIQFNNFIEETTRESNFQETYDHAGADRHNDEPDFSLGLSSQGAVIGTAAYMSPEQAEGCVEIGPASDIYSLGATFYFLLTGQPPYAGSSMDAVLQAVRAGKKRAPREICESIPPALDAICRKAMALAPNDRYPSPTEMAADLERWLADEPISVWRDSAHIVIRRWVRRHRVLSMAMGVAVVASLIGTSLFSLMVASHNRQLRIANESEQAARILADQQGNLALETLKSVIGDIQKKLQHIPAAQRVRQGLLETSLLGLEKVAVSLARSTEIDVHFLLAHRELGDLFLEIGNVGDYPGVQRAKLEFQTAHSIAQAMVNNNPSDIETGRQLALIVQRLADVESRTGSAAAALDQRLSALTMLERLHSIAPNDEQVIRSCGVAHNLLGDVYLQMGDTQNAGDHFLEALRIHEDQTERGVHLPDSDRDLIVSLNKVAAHYGRIGRQDMAEEMLQRSLLATEAILNSNPNDFQLQRDLSIVHYQLGKHCIKLGQMDKAVDHHQASQTLDVARLGLEPGNALAQRDALESTMQLADTLRLAGQRDTAILRSHEAIELGDRLLMANPDDRRAMRYLAYALGDLGVMLSEGENAEAESRNYLPLFQRCLALMTQAAELDPENPRGQYDIAYAMGKLASGYLAAGRPADALHHLDLSLTIHRDRCVKQPDNLVALHHLVETLRLSALANQALGQSDSAHDLFVEAAEKAARLAEMAPKDVAFSIMQIEVLHSFGKHLQASGEIELARQKFDKSLALAQELLRTGNAVNTAQAWIDQLNREGESQPD